MPEKRSLRCKSPQLGKLTPPSLPVVLQRPRLFRLLDHGRKRPLTWIAAPAGFGKTTLVASYLNVRRMPVCWYRLDEGDADPSSFFHYLSLAAKSLAPRFRKPLPILTPEYALGLSTFTRRFFQELCGRLPRRCVLVLDNYQDLPLTAPLHQLLCCALEELLPSQVSVVVMSRQSPPSAMAKVKADRKMALISPDQTELSKSEIRALVLLHIRKKTGSLVQKLVDELYRRMGGWAAGIVLTLEHARSRDVLTSAHAGDTPEAVFQYLAGEVLERLSPETQRLLLQTSILSDITPAIAERLTNVSNAGSLLASLHAGRCFTERREGPDPWYRYHSLFREFLLTQLANRYELKHIQRLRQIAAGLLAEAGRLEDSITMLRDAEDWPAMSRQIIALAPALLGQGRGVTVDGWISLIPEQLALETPWLRFWHACCRMLMNPHEAQLMFGQVFEQFVAQEDQAGALLAWTNLVRCILFQWKGLPRLDKWIDRFASLQPDGVLYPSTEIEAHVAEAMAGALVWRRPANPQTRQWLERAITLNDRITGSGAGHAIFMTESYLAWLGDLDGVRKGNDRLSEAASKPGAAPSKKIVYYLSESMLAWIEGRVENCRTAVREGLSLAEREGIHLWDGWLIFQGIHNDLLSGDLDAAWGQLEKVKCGPLEGLYLSQYCYHAAWHAMLKGDAQNALPMIEQAVEVSVQDGGPFPEALCCLLAASISRMVGDHQKAESYRLRTATISEAMGSNLLLYGTLLLAAQFALESDDRVKGLKVLRDAFAFGRKYGMTEYPGWHAQAIALLCATALEEQIEVTYVHDLIRKRWLPLAPELRPAAWPWPVKIRMLGPLRVEINGTPLETHRKPPHRLLDLLKTLVVLSRRAVPVTRVMDILWPEADGDQAQENLKKSIARLRRLLGGENVIQWLKGEVSLSRELCWVDAWAFEASAKHAESRTSTSKPQHDGHSDARALALYTGPVLGWDEIPEWAAAYRSDLRNRWIRLVTRRSDLAGKEADANDVVCELEAAIAIDPVAEPLYQRLISLLLALDRRAEAMTCYDRCRSALARWAGRTPSFEMGQLTMATRRADGA